ncbi:fungal-specific transcription factor domain-containing protein [Aspergillus varians]
MPTITTDGEQVKPFACPACPGRFTRQENLTRHTASVHRRSNLRPFPCPQCDVSFSRSDLRKRHVRKYHLQEGRPQAVNVSEDASKLAPFPAEQPMSSSRSIPGENAYSIPLTPPASTTFSAPNISWLFKLPLFISAYFDKFQTIFPIIHQPTFDTASTHEPLLQAVACIGAVYHSAGGHHDISLALMQSGLQSLDAYVDKHRCAGFREVWVVQAYVLFEYFALHSCDDTLFATALGIHRRLVDAARQYQLLQDNITLEQPGDDTLPIPDLESLLSGASVGRDWQLAIRSEARKRAMYSLYYLDAQMSVCCNVRPLLTALEIKYELPCRDDVWAAPTASTWQTLIISQDGSFNEADDDAANADPRPAQGDLYSSLMYLMSPAPPGKHLGLLWNSAFSSLMLVMQVQMMVRDLILGSTFLYHNIRSVDDIGRRTLSIISEPGRAQVMQALDALADLMPRPTTSSSPPAQNPNPHVGTGAGLAFPIDIRLWNHVWIAWHYTALCLTHQDGLLTNGIVEYSLPTAISTAWELGKPRSKPQRDVYEDRDVIRVAASLESILGLLTRPVLGAAVGRKEDRDRRAAEDPFITMLGFKACLMGWRTVRLLALGLQDAGGGAGVVSHMSTSTNIYALSARVLIHNILASIDLEGGGDGSRQRRGSGGGGGEVNAHTPDSISSFAILNDSEAQYLERVEVALARRNVWPVAAWIGAVFTETRPGSMGYA